jgi:hypothetical protein
MIKLLAAVSPSSIRALRLTSRTFAQNVEVAFLEQVEQLSFVLDEDGIQQLKEFVKSVNMRKHVRWICIFPPSYPLSAGHVEALIADEANSSICGRFDDARRKARMIVTLFLEKRRLLQNRSFRTASRTCSMG